MYLNTYDNIYPYPYLGVADPYPYPKGMGMDDLKYIHGLPVLNTSNECL